MVLYRTTDLCVKSNTTEVISWTAVLLHCSMVRSWTAVLLEVGMQFYLLFDGSMANALRENDAVQVEVDFDLTGKVVDAILLRLLPGSIAKEGLCCRLVLAVPLVAEDGEAGEPTGGEDDGTGLGHNVSF